jgi:hypothetical protein
MADLWRRACRLLRWSRVGRHGDVGAGGRVCLRFSLLCHVILSTLSLSPCPHVLPANSLSSHLSLTLCSAPQVMLYTYIIASDHPCSARLKATHRLLEGGHVLLNGDTFCWIPGVGTRLCPIRNISQSGKPLHGWHGEFSKCLSSDLCSNSKLNVKKG